MGRTYAVKFPGVSAIQPESVFSRAFVQEHPDIWENELLPTLQQAIIRPEVQPTLTHTFCAHLAHRGWLKRIYTQNIDGLHLHPSLSRNGTVDTPLLDEDLVVECHGSIRTPGTLVLYGDPLPQRFTDMASVDFHPSLPKEKRVDLLLVFGTSLQVAPFCGWVNMAPKYCTPVLVNRRLQDCIVNPFQASCWVESGYKLRNCTRIGSCRSVSLASHWMDRDKIRKKKWRQLLVEDDCDSFVKQYTAKTGTVL